MQDCLIAIDAGTTSVRAMLYDRELVRLASAERPFPQHFPSPGLVEHDALDIRRAVEEVLASLAEHPRARDVVALGLTNQRETLFALDLESGEALGRGIVWQDRRTAARCEELRQQGRGDWIRERTGLPLDPYFSATKAEWMLRERPAVRAAAERGSLCLATVDALLVHHLVGSDQVATEPTNASRTMLYDLERRAWSPQLCSLFGIDPRWLPRLRPSGSSFGLLARTPFAGRPLHGVAGDQQAALFGQGALEPGAAKLTYGTGCFLLVQTRGRARSSAGLLTTLGIDRRGEPSWVLEGSVFSGGSIVQWLRDGLGLVARASESEGLARSVPDAGGVVLVPAFTGLGAPYWDAEARGALLGLTRGTTRAHLARAALEAIAWQCAELVECVRADTHLALGELGVDGGASANDLLLELQADFAGLVVRRPADVETTALGAARLAGSGCGLWSDAEQPSGPRREGRRFEPRMRAAERADRLARWRRAVERVRGPL